MRALKIDPEHSSVKLIDVDPADVGAELRSAVTDTIELEEEHCLVIDDGSGMADHPARFRFADDPQQRPYFGPALILGLQHGNWAGATLNAGPIRARIIWEKWDREARQYAAIAKETP